MGARAVPEPIFGDYNGLRRHFRVYYYKLCYLRTDEAALGLMG